MKTILATLLFCFPLSLGAAELGDFPAPQTRDVQLFKDETGLLQRGGELEGRDGHEAGDVSAGGSIGLAFDEIGFLVTGEADFWITRWFSLGPQAQLNIGTDVFLLIGAGPKFTFDFGDNEFNRYVKPYVYFGPALVLAIGEHQGRSGHRRHDPGTEAGVAATLGIGVDFYLNRELSLGTGFLWNWLVTRPLDDRFYFGWKIIEAKVHF